MKCRSWLTNSQYHSCMNTFANVQKRHIRLMRLTCQTLGNILAGVSQETATALRDGPDGWTTLEVVCHLRDFDCYFMDRAQWMLKGDYPLLPAYDHERIAVAGEYNRQDLQQAYAELRASREQFAQFFEGLTEGQWALAGVHPGKRPLDLARFTRAGGFA